MYKIGFIGCGKMAKAIIKGIITGSFIACNDVVASKKSLDNLENLSKELKIKIVTDNKYVAENSDIIFLAVKPTQSKEVIEEIKSYITTDKLVISVMAGVTTKQIEEFIPKTRIIRVMPNTPVLVNEGMSGICKGQFATQNDVEYVQKLFNSIGESVLVEENQIDLVTAISGSGPAFFYKVINEIARSGEKLGMDYDKALLLSIQTALGSAKMALKREISMENLIANVATKGGCTAVGTDCMDKYKTSEIFYDVIKSTMDKASQLSNK